MERLTKKYVSSEISEERYATFGNIDDAIAFVDNDNYLCYNIRLTDTGWVLVYRQTINHPRFDKVKNKESYTDYSKLGGVECPWYFLD